MTYTADKLPLENNTATSHIRPRLPRGPIRWTYLQNDNLFSPLLLFLLFFTSMCTNFNFPDYSPFDIKYILFIIFLDHILFSASYGLFDPKYNLLPYSLSLPLFVIRAYSSATNLLPSRILSFLSLTFLLLLSFCISCSYHLPPTSVSHVT